MVIMKRSLMFSPQPSVGTMHVYLQEHRLVWHSHAQLALSVTRWNCPISQSVSPAHLGDTAAPLDWLLPLESALLGKKYSMMFGDSL